MSQPILLSKDLTEIETHEISNIENDCNILNVCSSTSLTNMKLGEQTSNENESSSEHQNVTKTEIVPTNNVYLNIKDISKKNHINVSPDKTINESHLEMNDDGKFEIRTEHENLNITEIVRTDSAAILTEATVNIPERSREIDSNESGAKLNNEDQLEINDNGEFETRTEHENGGITEIVPTKSAADVTVNVLEISKETNSNESRDKPNNATKSNLVDDNGESVAETDERDFILNEHEDKVQIKKKPKKFVIDSESEDETDKSNQTDNNSGNKESESLLSGLAGLCDSDSSEGEHEVRPAFRRQKEVLKFRKSSIKEKNPKVKKMTAKEALLQRQEIKSESQRMLRETPVLLPYHKPKERSIIEFLKNRPRLSLLKTVQDAPASAAIKMTTEELKIVTKKMKEREEELQIFYKSESDSEEEFSNEQKKINETTIATSDDINNHEGVSQTNKSTCCDQAAGEDRVEVDESIHIRILDESSNIDDVAIDSTEVEKPMEIDEPNSSTIQESLNRNEIVEDEQVQFEGASKTQNVQKGSENIESDQNCNLNIEENGDDLFCEEEQSKCENNLSNDTNNDKGKIIIHSIVTIPKQSMYEFEDSMDYDFNLDGIEEIPVNDLKSQSDDNANAGLLAVSKQDLLKRLENHTPRLSSNLEIDLDEDIVEPNGVFQFIERFKKQVEVKVTPKSNIKLDIINLSQGKIHIETVDVPIDNKEQPIDATDKPALRTQILRKDLQEQIAQQRAKLWKEKQQALEEMTKLDDEEPQAKSDYEDNILDDDADDEGDEIEEQTTDEVDTDEDEQENAETHRIKSAFIDGEADESDDNEDMEVDGENDEVSRDSELTAEDDTDSVTSKPKKGLKRIIQVFPEDSDEESLFNEEKITFRDDDDINIPPYQPRIDKTPHKEMTQSKSDIMFHTPITQLSALQDLNSGSKFRHESPISPFPFPPPSPSVDTPTVKQKLFSDYCDVFNAETNTQELIGICSGDFPITNNKETEPCTQDLISICSGSFEGLTNHKARLDLPETVNESDDVVSDTKLSNNSNSNSQTKYLDEDRLISQLLDEDEMEQFKKKFESPVTNKSDLLNNSEVAGGGRLVFDSSDDEQEGNNVTVKVNKHKQLHFSDDDSESEEENGESDEAIDLHDDLDNATNKEIDYDSEENEIEVPKNKYKASDFLEKEAELSESDWDSDDEDERGLDNLEQEQGDDELFDENKLKNDLERIHMRNVLDQDNREIKILQELLLENGELHGEGRQRQFRWKNIDDNANDDKGPIDGDEVYLEEDENEEQWRKLRHEREMFLKSQTDKQDEDCIDSILSDSNSQVFKIGQEALRRSVSNSSGQSDKDKTVSSSDALRKAPALTNTRGSFLARSNNFLTRLADITKVNSTTTSVIKTSTKIVFQTSTSLDEHNSINNKRKADDGTPIAIKKLRLSSNISPSLKGLERKKKLF